MNTKASQITSVSIVYSTVCLGADQRKHQSSASLTFMSEIHRWPVNSPHKWPVTRKMFPFDDVIMIGYEIKLEYLRYFSRYSTALLRTHSLMFNKLWSLDGISKASVGKYFFNISTEGSILFMMLRELSLMYLAPDLTKISWNIQREQAVEF